MARLAWPKIAFLFQGTFLVWLISYAAVSWLDTTAYLNFKAVEPLTAVRMVFMAGVLFSAAYTLPSLSQTILRGKDFSYGLYLWHMLAICSFAAFGFTTSFWLWPAVAAASLTLAAASWFGIERPALRLKNLRRAYGCPIESDARARVGRSSEARGGP
jgi:peptidoglycan/LPS O-acetylase OafA/YrhL